MNRNLATLWFLLLICKNKEHRSLQAVMASLNKIKRKENQKMKKSDELKIWGRILKEEEVIEAKKKY